MKLFVLISVILAGCCRMIAQPPAPGSNVVNNNINKFEGVWHWVNGNDTLILKLKKINKQFGDYTEDVLLGVHKYIKNGLVLDDALNKYDSMVLYYKKSTVLLYQNQDTDTSKVFGSIKDLTKKKTNNLFLQYVNGTPPTIIWHLETAEGTFIDPNFQYGLTMPKDVILTRQ
ncbi:MAG: hypothetical protein NTW29_20670 [Bacteroidetes bacterium]|nr:hypothetical protein [Bacteroidota bacterium]